MKWLGNESESMLESLTQATVSLEKCLEICGPNPLLKEALEDNRILYEYFRKQLDGKPGQPPDDPDSFQPLKITKKSAPAYSREARKDGTQGTIRLAVMFRGNGTIGPVVLLQGLPSGLNEMAINSARGIEFQPARRNGVPVSEIKTIVYTFDIY